MRPRIESGLHVYLADDDVIRDLRPIIVLNQSTNLAKSFRVIDLSPGRSLVGLRFQARALTMYDARRGHV